MLDIVGSPPGKSGQNRLQEAGQRDRRLGNAMAAARYENTILFQGVKRENQWKNMSNHPPATGTTAPKGGRMQHGPAAIPEWSVTASAPSDIRLGHGRCDTDRA
jgi:hypothetical protein